jgi:choline-sulfatase
MRIEIRVMIETIAKEAVHFLQHEAKTFDQTWVLFVSFVTPHFPLIEPKEFYDLYPHENVLLPRQYSLSELPMHPVIQKYREIWGTNEEFDEASMRKAIAAYYGLCSFMDDQVGIVLRALEENGLSQNTRIIYTSDHVDTLGEHGVWFKSSMHEGSVGVPFIMAGPDLPKGKVCEEQVSLVDCYPTILEGVGAPFTASDQALPGSSLWAIAKGDDSKQGRVFSEYHAAGFVTGTFMIRVDNYKYIYYVDYPPQLFAMENDPNELNDLAGNPEYQSILQQCERELRQIINPEEVDRLAKEDQDRKIEEHGGREAILKEGFKIPYSPIPAHFLE